MIFLWRDYQDAWLITKHQTNINDIKVQPPVVTKDEASVAIKLAFERLENSSNSEVIATVFDPIDTKITSAKAKNRNKAVRLNFETIKKLIMAYKYA